MPYRIMQAQTVNKKVEEGDARLYYCDPDVDLVVTTISKPHRGPSHRHMRNTESYYVLRGKLTMHVDERREELGEGDMLVVNPGVWHSFETGAHEVCFLTIKKLPQLANDKEEC